MELFTTNVVLNSLISFGIKYFLHPDLFSTVVLAADYQICTENIGQNKYEIHAVCNKTFDNYNIMVQYGKYIYVDIYSF